LWDPEVFEYCISVLNFFVSLFISDVLLTENLLSRFLWDFYFHISFPISVLQYPLPLKPTNPLHL